MKKINLCLSLVILWLSTSLYAVPIGVSAVVIPFTNNQTIPLRLSSVDPNKILVKGDKIISVDCPQGFCTPANRDDDESGAIIFQLNVTTPFTMFVATEGGQQFGLLVQPSSEPGITIQFEPIGGSVKADSFEKSAPYEQLIIQVLKKMIAYERTQEAPEGYSTTLLTKAKAENIGHLEVTPHRFFRGSQLIGIIYIIKNNTKEVITLDGTKFYKKSVRALAIFVQDKK